MTLDDLNNVLSLMVAIIFADKQVFETEIATLIQCVSQLDFDTGFSPHPPSQLNITPDLLIQPTIQADNGHLLNGSLSPSEISNWYEKNKGQIHASLSTPYYKDWFYNLLDQLADLPSKEKIITVMREISKTDGHVHINERALITLAERHWGMR